MELPDVEEVDDRLEVLQYISNQLTEFSKLQLTLKMQKKKQCMDPTYGRPFLIQWTGPLRNPATEFVCMAISTSSTTSEQVSYRDLECDLNQERCIMVIHGKWSTTGETSLSNRRCAVCFCGLGNDSLIPFIGFLPERYVNQSAGQIELLREQLHIVCLKCSGEAVLHYVRPKGGSLPSPLVSTWPSKTKPSSSPAPSLSSRADSKKPSRCHSEVYNFDDEEKPTMRSGYVESETEQTLGVTTVQPPVPKTENNALIHLSTDESPADPHVSAPLDWDEAHILEFLKPHLLSHLSKYTALEQCLQELIAMVIQMNQNLLQHTATKMSNFAERIVVLLDSMQGHMVTASDKLYNTYVDKHNSGVENGDKQACIDLFISPTLRVQICNQHFENTELIKHVVNINTCDELTDQLRSTTPFKNCALAKLCYCLDSRQSDCHDGTRAVETVVFFYQHIGIDTLNHAKFRNSWVPHGRSDDLPILIAHLWRVLLSQCTELTFSDWFTYVEPLWTVVCTLKTHMAFDPQSFKWPQDYQHSYDVNHTGFVWDQFVRTLEQHNFRVFDDTVHASLAQKQSTQHTLGHAISSSCSTVQDINKTTSDNPDLGLAGHDQESSTGELIPARAHITLTEFQYIADAATGKSGHQPHYDLYNIREQLTHRQFLKKYTQEAKGVIPKLPHHRIVLKE